MTISNRATLINKTIKVVKKHYKHGPVSTDRTLFENILYACCLENSLHEAADQVFEVLTRDYYDWNEVRVSTIRELTDVMKPLNDPEDSATRLKRVLQSVFETHYSFDLEALKKQNIGQAAKGLRNYHGTSSFIVSYVTQNSLGGHSIPVNWGLLESLRIVGVISDTEAAKGTVPGLERAIPKNKGIEAGILLHQLGVELHRSPYGPAIRKILLEIAPECKQRLPKRAVKKSKQAEQEEAKPQKSQPSKLKPQTGSKSSAGGKKAAGNKPAKAKEVKNQTRKKSPVKKKVAAKKPVVKKTSKVKKDRTVKKKTVKKKSVGKKAVKKKVGKKGKILPSSKGKKKAANKRLAKRKPR